MNGKPTIFPNMYWEKPRNDFPPKIRPSTLATSPVSVILKEKNIRSISKLSGTRNRFNHCIHNIQMWTYISLAVKMGNPQWSSGPTKWILAQQKLSKQNLLRTYQQDDGC